MTENVMVKAGLILLALGGCSGILLYLATMRPVGWARIKNLNRVRQGHVDALIIGAIFLAVSTAGVIDNTSAAVLITTGFYTALSTGALGWWPNFPEKHRSVLLLDFIALSGFALVWVWIAARAVFGL